MEVLSSIASGVGSTAMDHWDILTAFVLGWATHAWGWVNVWAWIKKEETAAVGYFTTPAANTVPTANTVPSANIA